jgi:uncharacterized protein YqeY
MTIIDLKKKMFEYKKHKNKVAADALMMLIDTIEKIAKEKNNDPNKYINQGIKKYLKQLEDAKKNGVDNKEEYEVIKKLAEKILPKELNNNELKHIIIEWKNDNPNGKLGMLMGWLKKNFGERVNMKKANEIAKEIL